MTPNTLHHLTLQVIPIVQEVGEFIAEERERFNQEEVETKSSAHDLVSYVDREAEAMLKDQLQQLLPEAGFIAEESATQYKEGLNWIIDPLDGTTNFVQQVPHYGISVALAKDQTLLSGVVFDICHKTCYHSFSGGKSYKNHEVIKVSRKSAILKSLIATGFSTSHHEHVAENLARLDHFVKQSRGVRRLGSAALDLCYVAEGVFDAFYETDLKVWDVAAGALLVQNAGGVVTDFAGGSDFLLGGQIAASGKLLHGEFLTTLNQFNQ